MNLTDLKKRCRAKAQADPNMTKKDGDALISEANRDALDKLDLEDHEAVCSMQQHLVDEIKNCGEAGALELIAAIGNRFNELEAGHE